MNFDFSYSKKWSVQPRTGQKMERSFLRFMQKHWNRPKNGAFRPFLAIAGLQKMETLLIYQVVTAFLSQHYRPQEASAQ